MAPMAKNDWAVKIAERLKDLREGRKLTLAQLAEETGGRLSKQRIGNYEQGTRMPGPKEAVVLAEALGVSAARVLCLDEQSNNNVVGSAPIASSKRPTGGSGELPDEWVKVYRLLRPEERELLMAEAKISLRQRNVNVDRIFYSPEELAEREAHSSEDVEPKEESALQDKQQLQSVPARADMRQAHDVAGDHQSSRVSETRGRTRAATKTGKQQAKKK